jgi:hypothetical protein
MHYTKPDPVPDPGLHSQSRCTGEDASRREQSNNDRKIIHYSLSFALLCVQRSLADVALVLKAVTLAPDPVLRVKAERDKGY